MTLAPEPFLFLEPSKNKIHNPHVFFFCLYEIGNGGLILKYAIHPKTCLLSFLHWVKLISSGPFIQYIIKHLYQRSSRLLFHVLIIYLMDSLIHVYGAWSIGIYMIEGQRLCSNGGFYPIPCSKKNVRPLKRNIATYLCSKLSGKIDDKMWFDFCY